MLRYINVLKTFRIFLNIPKKSAICVIYFIILYVYIIYIKS